MTTHDKMRDELVTRHVAAQVEALRKQRGWSVQHLADRCADAGQPSLKRSVLVNLERGRRRYLTIGELRALGDAFGVAPVALLPADERLELCGWIAIDEHLGTLSVVGRDMRHLLHRTAAIVDRLGGTAKDRQLVDAWAANLDRWLGDADELHRRFLDMLDDGEEPR